MVSGVHRLDRFIYLCCASLFIDYSFDRCISEQFVILISMSPSRLLLFDVDGTLTAPRLSAEPSMLEFLDNLRGRDNLKLGFVGGSDLSKISEQLGSGCEKNFDYGFSENGLVAFKDGIKLASNSILKHFGEGLLQRIINFSLGYIAKLDIPVKRGTFVEFRTGK